MKLVKVAARSNPAAVAGAIANIIRESNEANVQAIGASAVAQAVRAIIIAKGHLAKEGVYIIFVPSFVTVTIGDQERTAVRLVVRPQ